MLVSFLGSCSLGGEETAQKDFKGDRPISAMSGEEMAALPEGSDTKPPLQEAGLEEGSASDVNGHPDIGKEQRSVQRELVLPEDVQGKWKAVKIMIRHKKDEEKNEMKVVNLGDQFDLGDSGIHVRVGSFLPNFVMSQNAYTSNGNELVNPAIHLKVEEGDKVLYDGWTFAKYPTMYAFEHEAYALQLMDFIPAPVS